MSTFLRGLGPVVGLLVVGLSVGCGGDDVAPDAAAGIDAAARCASDVECDDELFCNGAEQCSPEASGADERGCVAAVSPCTASQECQEDVARCVTTCPVALDADGDGHDTVECGGDDCDDSDARRHPSASEICDPENVDEDCNPATFGDRDLDRDGFHDARCCNGDTCGRDCDDTRAGAHPIAPEVCDRRDNDCDGSVDEELLEDRFADVDRDLHGDPDAPVLACPGRAGTSVSVLDCDDADPLINRTMGELRDGADNDCDGAVDEFPQSIDWYRDQDGDRFGDAAAPTIFSDTVQVGYSILPLDCDDGDAARSPLALELCNAIDDDCDGEPSFVIAQNDWEDDDGDGFPDAACAGGHPRADCDDTDAATGPGRHELCDRRDNDCDGSVDEGCSAPTPMDGGVPDGGRLDAGVSDAGVSDAGPTEDYVELALGINHSCGRDAAGSVFCWGANSLGQLGDTTMMQRPTPRGVVGLNDARQLDAGDAHTCALRSTGQVVCWGANASGQLGDNGFANSAIPRHVDALADATAIAAGGIHSCAIRGAGAVVCWGDNDFGQLGNGTTDDSAIPVSVTGLSDAIALSAGARHSCAVRASGQVVCWGDNASGQLGDGTTTRSLVPVETASLADAMQLSAGASHTCAIRASGQAVCWGDNEHGSLGDGSAPTDTTTPVAVSTLGDAVDISAGTHYTCAVRVTGQALCWGLAMAGQLGNGTTLTRVMPRNVTALASAIDIEVGAIHSCARRADGRSVCWGNNADGKLGTGDAMDQPTPTLVLAPMP